MLRNKYSTELKITETDIRLLHKVTLFFDLLKARHLAEERGSNSLISDVGDSGSSVFFNEASLEPLKHPCWFGSKLLAEKTPAGV